VAKWIGVQFVGSCARAAEPPTRSVAARSARIIAAAGAGANSRDCLKLRRLGTRSPRRTTSRLSIPCRLKEGLPARVSAWTRRRRRGCSSGFQILPASVEPERAHDRGRNNGSRRFGAGDKDAAAANAVAVKARDAIVAAASKLNEAERDLKAARTALEEARDGQRPIAERLAEAGSDEERWQLIDEQSAPKEREAVTVADLREARVLVLDAEDGVIVARSALEQLQQSSTAATAMANRANNRRQKAINEVVRRECARLMQAAERLTRELADARLSLRFVSANLVDGMGDERRQIYRLGISGRCSRRNSASRPSLARLWRRGGLLRRRLRETLPRPSRPEILNPGPSPGSPSDEWASSAWRFPGSRGGGFFQTIENYHERMTTKRHQMDAVRTASNGGLSGKIFASS
jgi:hypothetical protein